MNRLRLLLICAPVLVTGAAWSAPVCNGGATCERPDVTAQAPTINASSLLGLQSLNSVGPNGNQVNSSYWFAVTTTDHGLSSAAGTIVNTGDGLTVIGNTPTHNASATPSSTVNAGAVQGTKGGTAYYLYAQACPNGTAANGTNCSAWTKVDASQITTTAYPVSVFAVPTKPTDTTTNTIAVRTAVPAGDVSNVSVIDLTINDLITPANSQSIAAITYTGNASPYIIDDTLFTNDFIPNTKYSYSGQVQYPWDLVPTGGAQTEGPFWTTPVNPGTVTTANITHCSVQITAQNSSGSPANPSYTTYNLCATGSGGNCANHSVSGGTPSDTSVVTISGLTPGTAYTPNAQALVGNGDGSSSGWNSSGVTNGTGFSTLGFAGTFGTASIATNAVDFTFSGLDLTGVTSYQMSTDGGATFGAVVNSVPVSPIHVSGLTPNTSYTLKIKLIEASCNSVVPTSGVTFFTLPAAPTVPDFLTATSPTVLQSSWTDAATPTGNPNGTTYTVNYCLDAGFSSGCHTAGATKASTSPSATLTIGVVPETQYFAEVKAIGLGGTDSGWLNLGSATTPNQAPTVPVPTFTIFSSSVALADAASDNGGVSHLVYQWTVTAKPAGASPTFTANGTNAARTTFMNFDRSGGYTVQVTVTDHDGVGGLSTSNSVSFTVGQVPTTISLSPTVPTVGRGQSLTFNATVYDPFLAPISGESVNWSVPAPAGGVSPASGASTVYTAGNTVGAYTLSATDGGASTTTVITVAANTVTVTPTGQTIGRGGTLQMTSLVQTPQSVTITPTISWSVSGCAGSSISSGGLLTAGNTTGTCTVTATTQYGDTGSTTVTVIANTVVVSPASPANIGTGGTQAFSAAVTNPSGTTITPTITWSVSACNGANSINSSGLFSANVADATACVITATTQFGDAGTSHITVDNTLPQITVQPTATVFVTTAALSVNGSAHVGPLTYTWSLVSPTGAAVDFSSQNGTTTGNNVIATFHAVGTYVFKVTLADTGVMPNPTNSANTTPVAVVSVLTGITVSPTNITIQALNDQAFTASGIDQFGNATSPGSVVWSTSGGNISGAGVFNSPGLGSNITVSARHGNIVGIANVNVVSFNVSGAYAYPVPFKSTRDQVVHFVSLGSQSTLRIYSTGGREVFSINLNQNTYDWDTKNSSGDRVASGVYFYFVQSSEGKKDGKLIIIQ